MVSASRILVHHRWFAFGHVSMRRLGQTDRSPGSQQGPEFLILPTGRLSCGLPAGQAGVASASRCFPPIRHGLVDDVGRNASGLIATILGSIRFRPDTTPLMVGRYITAAYWFTASTSFANPAVTIARSLSNTSPASPPLPLRFLSSPNSSALPLLRACSVGSSKKDASHERRLSHHHLPQPRLRHLAQHSGDDRVGWLRDPRSLSISRPAGRGRSCETCSRPWAPRRAM